MIIGVTHGEKGERITRTPRTLKVMIGPPKAFPLRVYIESLDGKPAEWVVALALDGGKKESFHRFPTRQEAEAFYKANRGAQPVDRPRKLGYFTLSKPVVGRDGRDAWEPDFDAIAACGEMPTEIPIIFTAPDPFDCQWELWGANELRCSGNGVNANRNVNFDPNNPLAIKAKDAGRRTFPLADGCANRGCPYANVECRVSSRLVFQVVGSFRIGGTAIYSSHGYETTKILSASLAAIEGVLDNLGGISLIGLRMRLKMSPYTTNKDGRAATQYKVWVEMDPAEFERLQTGAWRTAAVAAAPARQQLASADIEPDEPEGEPPQPAVAVATQAKQSAIASKLATRVTTVPPQA